MLFLQLAFICKWIREMIGSGQNGFGCTNTAGLPHLHIWNQKETERPGSKESPRASVLHWLHVSLCVATRRPARETPSAASASAAPSACGSEG